MTKEAITAADDHKGFSWMKYQGARGVKLHHDKGHVMLKKGDKWAYKDHKDHSKIVTEHHGHSRVHKVSLEHANRMFDRSNHAGVPKEGPAKAPPKKAPPKDKNPHATTEKMVKSLHEHVGTENGHIEQGVEMKSDHTLYTRGVSKDKIHNHLKSLGFKKHPKSKYALPGSNDPDYYHHPSGHMAQIRGGQGKKKFGGTRFRTSIFHY